MDSNTKIWRTIDLSRKKFITFNLTKIFQRIWPEIPIPLFLTNSKPASACSELLPILSPKSKFYVPLKLILLNREFNICQSYFLHLYTPFTIFTLFTSSYIFQFSSFFYSIFCDLNQQANKTVVSLLSCWVWTSFQGSK